MLENWSSLAIVPRAKAIAARRLSHDDYLELMRRRSVVEVVATLQSHPYFKDSLAGFPQSSLHRAQLEEALRKDVFFKYEKLMRYSFRKGHFGAFFMVRCEIDEILVKMRLLAQEQEDVYIVQLPGFLVNKMSFSLIKLAKAPTVEDCIKALAGTPYAKILTSVAPQKGQKFDYLLCEHAFESFYYTDTLKKLDADLSGSAAADTRKLFVSQAEMYNLDLLYRCKAFFPKQFTPLQLRRLLLPVYGVLSEKKLLELVLAKDFDSYLTLYNASRAVGAYGAHSKNASDTSETQEQRVLYRRADHLLHFTSSPQTALACVLCIAMLERSNIINVIEGVRYGLAPNQIEQYLKS